MGREMGRKSVRSEAGFVTQSVCVCVCVCLGVCVRRGCKKKKEKLLQKCHLKVLGSAPTPQMIPQHGRATSPPIDPGTVRKPVSRRSQPYKNHAPLPRCPAAWSSRSRGHPDPRSTASPPPSPLRSAKSRSRRGRRPGAASVRRRLLVKYAHSRCDSPRRPLLQYRVFI
jgi:hypothetical protein